MTAKELAKETAIQNLINEVHNLTERNETITRSGKWFTDEQKANEKRAWILKMELRHKHGREVGTYWQSK